MIGRIIAESDFFEPLKPGSYITPGFGGCVYFPTGKGFIVLRIMPKSTSPACKDNFGKDPPNATLSVYEPGQPDNTVVVVEITNPVVDGADLIYSYKIIDGKMPASGGTTSLFIDWIGAGGGVGPGFHGVGVGRRGVGIR